MTKKTKKTTVRAPKGEKKCFTPMMKRVSLCLQPLSALANTRTGDVYDEDSAYLEVLAKEVSTHMVHMDVLS
jgi:hypothetical protein